MYYFDNAASTKVYEKAAKKALYVMQNIYANPFASHKFGISSLNIINDCKKLIADILGCSPFEIFFTSGATESINTAILGCARKTRKKKILTTAIEHTSTKNCLIYLKNKGFEVVYIYPKDGKFNVKDFCKAVDKNCFLLTIIHVNNENGLIAPIEDIAKAVKLKNKEVIIHVDMAQSFCKIPLNIKNIDMISISGHKINAPKGIGLLYINKKIKISPLMFGGAEINDIRPGTKSTALIAALDVASGENYSNMTKNMMHYKDLRNIIIKKFENNKNINLNFNENCAPYIVNISLKTIKSQILVNFLEEKGFFLSAASSCSKNKKSRTLIDLGYSKDIQDSAIRISFGIYNISSQVEKLCDAILEAEKIFT